MKIAFTSCFSAQSFHQQPVWDQIGAAQPTALVLLGDSAYYDADNSDIGTLQEMSANDFAIHAFGRLRDQLNLPQFARLVSQVQLTTHAIWDDHDFLWNGACGAQIERQPRFKDLIGASRAAFSAFREALASHDPSSFPQHPPAWNPGLDAPGYRRVELGQGIWLHLTDGRSFKTKGGKKALLGKAQMTQLENGMRDHPDDVHLVASGVVFEARNGETWMDCPEEHAQMLNLASRFRILMLSGDIHENRIAASYQTIGARQMFEVTSSGAALQTLVTVGALQCNWGLLTIDDDAIDIQLSQIGMSPRQRTIDRKTWALRP